MQLQINIDDLQQLVDHTTDAGGSTNNRETPFYPSIANQPSNYNICVKTTLDDLPILLSFSNT